MAVAVILALGGAAGVATGPAAAAPAHVPVQHGSPDVLRRGSSGPRVVALQNALRAKGYGIAADGRFGPGTERAVKAFQASVGLVADGLVGPKTSIALGLTTTAAAPATPATPTTPPTTDGVVYTHPRSSVERWHAAAITAGWSEGEWQQLSCIINRESGGVATARNRSSGAAGLLQIMWSAHSSWIGGSADQLLDGPTNLRLGRQLFLRSGWGPWKSTTKHC